MRVWYSKAEVLIKRIGGLFKSSVGMLINADVNGAINILRKCKGEVFDEFVKLLACRGLVYRLRKLRFAGSGSFAL